jgi:hypothetical protein
MEAADRASAMFPIFATANAAYEDSEVGAELTRRVKMKSQGKRKREREALEGALYPDEVSYACA